MTPVVGLLIIGCAAIAVIWMTHRSGFVQGIHAARASGSADTKGYKLVNRQWVLPGKREYKIAKAEAVPAREP